VAKLVASANFDTSPNVLRQVKAVGVIWSNHSRDGASELGITFFQSAALIRRIMAEMNLARAMGVVVGFLAVLTYGDVISVRLAVLIFLLSAACLVYLVFIWPRRGK
jgi:hypothetical protein